jgi:hypothetical protein
MTGFLVLWTLSCPLQAMTFLRVFKNKFFSCSLQSFTHDWSTFILVLSYLINTSLLLICQSMGNNYSTTNDSADPCYYTGLYNLATLCRTIQCHVDGPISMANYGQLYSTRGQCGNNPGLLMHWFISLWETTTALQMTLQIHVTT